MTLTRKAAIGVATAVVLLGLLVFLVGARSTVQALWQTGWPAFATVGATLFGLMACQAAAWSRLEREAGDRIGYWTLLASTIVAMAGNVVLPSAHLGGEPAKILYAGKRAGVAYTRVAGIVLLCKYLEAMSFVAFLAFAAAATLGGLRGVLLGPRHWPFGVGIIIMTALAIVMCGIMWLALARRWTPLAALVGACGRLGIGRAFFMSLRQRSVRMELGASRVFREERRAVAPAFVWYVFTHAALFVRPGLFFWFGWGTRLNLAELSLLFVAGQLMLMVQFMPSGIGTLDGGTISVVALAGMAVTVPQVTAFLLCVRFWDALVVLLGMALAGRMGIGLFRAVGQSSGAPLPAKR